MLRDCIIVIWPRAACIPCEDRGRSPEEFRIRHWNPSIAHNSQVQPGRPGWGNRGQDVFTGVAPHGPCLLVGLGVVDENVLVDENAGGGEYLGRRSGLHQQGAHCSSECRRPVVRSSREAEAVEQEGEQEVGQNCLQRCFFLRLGAFLTLLDVVYISLVDTFGDKIRLIPSLFLTVDNCVVLASILILSGLVGPRDTLDQEEVLAELQYMGRTQGKRIAFPGKLNSHSQHCIVSFPGKYAEETWFSSGLCGVQFELAGWQRWEGTRWKRVEPQKSMICRQLLFLLPLEIVILELPHFEEIHIIKLYNDNYPYARAYVY